MQTIRLRVIAPALGPMYDPNRTVPSGHRRSCHAVGQGQVASITNGLLICCPLAVSVPVAVPVIL